MKKKKQSLNDSETNTVDVQKCTIDGCFSVTNNKLLRKMAAG